MHKDKLHCLAQLMLFAGDLINSHFFSSVARAARKRARCTCLSSSLRIHRMLFQKVALLGAEVRQNSCLSSRALRIVVRLVLGNLRQALCLSYHQIGIHVLAMSRWKQHSPYSQGFRSSSQLRLRRLALILALRAGQGRAGQLGQCGQCGQGKFQRFVPGGPAPPCLSCLPLWRAPLPSPDAPGPDRESCNPRRGPRPLPAEPGPEGRLATEESLQAPPALGGGPPLSEADYS